MTRQTTTEDEGGRGLEVLLEWVLARAAAHESCDDLEAYETEVIKVVHAIGAHLLELELARHEPEAREVLIDGERHVRVVEGVGTYMTVLGPVSVSRGRYRSVRNGPTLVPMEANAGVVEGFWTPKAAKVAALAVTDLTPGRAAALFAELGSLPASRSSFDRLPKSLGARWEADRLAFEASLRQSEEVPAEAASVAVSLDGVMVSMKDGSRSARKAAARARGRRDSGPVGRREATVGALSFYDEDGNRLCTRRVARMPETGQVTLRAQLHAELEHVREQSPNLHVVAVADGARGVWGFLEGVDADTEVVDFFHAAEHLKAALDQLMGATKRETHERYEELRRVLLNEPGGIDRIIEELEQLEQQRKSPYRLTRGSRYFKRHRLRMDYAGVRARGLPIGSGVIEGTCKSVVVDRLRRAGMRWSGRGGQAILTLRALSQSERFDRGWSLLHDTYRREVVEEPLAA
jgi:hypothetical protein